ncbi:AAA family ATPase [Leucobacter sp. cx-42]|uniref:AAA family ATPase n=1 Tax=unclassified Leucobacter TaxID=2621730 RepID=UPI00165DD8DC|nr:MULTISPECIES: AAA family ATPase [unclassified Leucobacter]MBC9954827.1 AAA family ATPase [Leucobacter sp. cx-42]
MLTPAAHPVLLEAFEIRDERREVLRALRAASDTPVGLASLLQTALAALDARWEELYADPDNRDRIDAEFDARARALRVAVNAHAEEHSNELQRARATEISTAAARANRGLIGAEEAIRDELIARTTGTPVWHAEVRDAATRDRVAAALTTLRVRKAKRELDAGLLLTAQMRNIIEESTPALLRGEPLLLIGETGGAKTALAEYLSRTELGNEPELISGYGDITSAQLIGAHELLADQGATVSRFVPGPLLRAMEAGHPLILDEVNAMPPEFLKRLNRILQLRPGDQFAVQEDGGRPVTIATGFAILATANEQTPHRYRGIDRLSAELVNRFGANTYRVHYPDTGNRFVDPPTENALLAAAATADRFGAVPFTADELDRVCRVAFISQQVFSGITGDGFSDFVSTEREIDGRPGLEEAVLAPRTLVAILRKAAGSGGRVSLPHALYRFVEGVMHTGDRHVLTLILQSQGFTRP